MNARFRIAMLAATALAATVAHAGEVYQWKDAKGVTHYSDEPPPAKAQARDVRHRDLALEAAANATEAKPTAAAAPPPPPTIVAGTDPGAGAIDPALAKANCAAARTNLERLKSGGSVGVDNNHDGTPDSVLSPEDVAQQTAVTQAQIKTFCGAAGTP